MPASFDLPRELEAHIPPEARGIARDEVGLLVSDRERGTHRVTSFRDFAAALHPNDLLVVNNSKTLAASVDAAFGGDVFPLHFSTNIADELWTVEPRTTAQYSGGEQLRLPGSALATLFTPVDRGHARLWYAKIETGSDVRSYLDRYGRPISYSYLHGSWPLEFYQTIFARKPGSVEMPSAARPFTLRTLTELHARGVQIATVTLHCGVASPERHERPVSEWMEIDALTAQSINDARAAGRRVVAVGTTVVRALESAASNGKVSAFSGWTDHLVTAQSPPQVTGALLTGLHEPRASHLDLLEGFIRPGLLGRSYEVAVEHGLLWHEFGDVHLVI
ncbi:MAG: S-adenosylmethionine:tRNA ribosyltransferase-isomerase [Candidatus Eremiobacteraeota bacterium]|nr:S-adenosylmethionine:tRNA ribosyltransferase-isomerase [Candidatus Eremiobacteraeota bacterium]